MFRKNTAGQFIHVQGVDATTGGIKSGVTWTVRRCIDGTFAAATGTATEDGATGWYKFALSQADTNGDNIGFGFTGTGAVPQTINIVTTVCDPTATDFGLELAKTTNITGFNDIGSADVTAAVPTVTENADALLNRDFSEVSDTNDRTLLNAARFLRNKFSSAAGVLTVTKEDDATTAWTADLTSDANADPITGIDPTT